MPHTGLRADRGRRRPAGLARRIRRGGRRSSSWSARASGVQVGHRNARIAEVLSGLTLGDEVVLHPSDSRASVRRSSKR
jgi:hypothetical protein